MTIESRRRTTRTGRSVVPHTGRRDARVAPFGPAAPAPDPRPRATRWWETSPRADSDRDIARIETREVLNFFEKCPRCGTFAQASQTVSTFSDGRVESVIQPTCGLPCGWQGEPRTH